GHDIGNVERIQALGAAPAGNRQCVEILKIGLAKVGVGNKRVRGRGQHSQARGSARQGAARVGEHDEVVVATGGSRGVGNHGHDRVCRKGTVGDSSEDVWVGYEHALQLGSGGIGQLDIVKHQR